MTVGAMHHHNSMTSVLAHSLEKCVQCFDGRYVSAARSFNKFYGACKVGGCVPPVGVGHVDHNRGWAMTKRAYGSREIRWCPRGMARKRHTSHYNTMEWSTAQRRYICPTRRLLHTGSARARFFTEWAIHVFDLFQDFIEDLAYACAEAFNLGLGDKIFGELLWACTHRNLCKLLPDILDKYNCSLLHN